MTPDPDLAALKAETRAEVAARRDALDPQARAAMSAAVSARAIALAETRPGASVALFVAMRSEVDLAAVAEWAHAGGRAVGLPAVAASGLMVFRRHGPGGALVEAGFGTVAPPENAPPVEPDVILAPLLAFDREGGRLGWGGGHYDRAIARMRTERPDVVVAGVAFSVQEMNRVPREPHDMLLDLVITEKETIACRRS